jgi:hypothetical protein
MIFDPVKVRRIAEQETLPRLCRTEFDEKRPMGNVAMMQLGDVIRLWLVGLSAETQDVLMRLHAWIEGAIERGEDFGESYNFHHMNLHQAAAIAHWMIYGMEDLEHWNQASILNNAISAHDNVYDEKGFLTRKLDEYLAYTYFSAQYEKGIVEFEKYSSLKSINAGVLKPREFGYVSCMCRSRSAFVDADVFKVGNKFLKKYMQEQWLGTGQFIAAVMWLKIVHEFGGENSLSPSQTILKAYENMPDVPIPLFLQDVTAKVS